MGDGIFSPWHIIIVLLVAGVLFYRGDKLPDMARSVGRSLRVFKTEIKGLAEDDKAREAAGSASESPAASAVETKAIEAPPVSEAPRVVAAPSEPLPVQAEIVRAPDSPARPRPRPAGSTTRP